MHYHDSEDLKRLGDFKQLTPMELSAFYTLTRALGATGAQSPETTRVDHDCSGMHNSVRIALMCTLAQSAIHCCGLLTTSYQQVLDSNRQLPYTNTSSVVYSVSNGCGDSG